VTNAVELRDVFRVHRTREGDAAALQGATLEVRSGELLAVLGPSGAGKSTLLRVVAGLEPPSAGVVRVLGRDIGRLPARGRAQVRREAIGFLDQRAHRALPPDLSAGAAVALPLALRGVGPRARAERARELLDAVGLADRAGALPAELSGGERQRVALCAALAHRPALLLADEPTGELDAASAEAVDDLLSTLARAQGASVVVVSHDPATAERADRAVRLRDGRVSEERRGGEATLVVGRGGWLQVPEGLLAEAGIDARVRARAHGGGVLLERAGEARAPAPAEPRPAATRTRAGEPATLEARALRRAVGAGRTRRVVHDGFTHAFAPGALTVVTGRSGAGKTTLLRLLAGLDTPDGGEVVLDGSPLTGDAEQLAARRRARIGVLEQEPGLVGFLAAEENVALARELRGRSTGGAAAWLARVGLGERARQRVGRLSAGERQRVGLARALAAADGLLVADEPTSRLDEASAGAVAALLHDAAHEHGLTVVCASHEPLVIARADHEVRL
jgi:ABC-type lipoprotein export system ATPase subunit